MTLDLTDEQSDRPAAGRSDSTATAQHPEICG